jgi:hypothetical protein
MSPLPQNTKEALDRVLSSQVVLYNGSEEDIRGGFNGEIYSFPAHKETVIRDIMDYPMDKSMRRARDQSLRPEFSAREIAEHLLLQFDGGLMDRGLTVLTGDKEIDDQSREEARDRAIRSRVARSRVLQAHWLAVVATAARSPNEPPPIMPQRVRSAIQFLKEHERDVLRKDRKRFICLIDSEEFDTMEEVAAYITANYAQRLAQEGTDDPSKFFMDLEAMQKDIEASAKKRQKKQEARERGEVDPEPASEPQPTRLDVILAKMEEFQAETKMKKSWLTGLLKRDPAAMAAVEEKLAEIEAEREMAPVG